MKKLKEISILGQTITIEHRKPKKETVGEYNIHNRTIYLNNNLKGDEAIRVLVHEMQHAALNIAGITDLISEEIEEALCTIAESYYTDLLEVMEQINEA